MLDKPRAYLITIGGRTFVREALPAYVRDDGTGRKAIVLAPPGQIEQQEDEEAAATKYNPYHDARGRFATGHGATSVSLRPGGYSRLQKERIAEATGASSIEARVGDNVLGRIRRSMFDSWQRPSDPSARTWVAQLGYDQIKSGAAQGLTLFDHGELVAIAATIDRGTHTEITYLASKRRGYGAIAMRQIAQTAAKRNQGIQLEALPEAVRFYEKLGFIHPDFDEEALMRLSRSKTRRLAR